MTGRKTKQLADDQDALRREIDTAVRKLAYAEVEADLAMDEAKKARRRADRIRRRLAVAQAKARAAEKQTN